MISIGTVTSSQVTANNPSFTATVDSGTTILLVSFHSMSNGGVNVTACTWNGTSMTKEIDTGGSHGNARGNVFSLANPTAGTHTVQGTSAASSKFGMSATCILNSATVTEVVQASGGSDTSITTLTDHSLCLNFATRAENSAVFTSVENDETVLYNTNFDLNAAFGAGYFIKPTIGQRNDGWNFTGNDTGNNCIIGITIAPTVINATTPVAFDTWINVGNAATPISNSMTVSGSNIMVVVSATYTGATHSLGTGAKIDGVSMTLLGSFNFSRGGTNTGAIYYGTTTAGTHTISVDCPEDGVEAQAASFTGSNAVNGFQSTSGSGASINVNVSSATDNLVVDFLAGILGTLTISPYETAIHNSGADRSAYKEGAPTNNMFWSIGFNAAGMMAANIVAGTQPQIKKVSGVLRASIKKISGVPLASIKKVSGVSN